MTSTVAVEPDAALPVLADASSLQLTAGGAVLGGYAWWQPEEAPAIVFAHGLGQDASFHADRARAFADRGWHAVCVASRGWPGSTGDPDDYGRSAETDLAAVVQAVESHRCSELWLFGFSAGGLWLTRGLPAVEGVRGVVTVNSPMNIRTTYRDTLASRMRAFYDNILTPHERIACSPVAVADRITAPMLTFGGTEDGMVPASQGREICALVPSSTYVEMTGMRHLPTADEWRQIMHRVDSWMTRVRERA
jgi:pimeloyl-ACP methyl ester carboxylesterase